MAVAAAAVRYDDITSNDNNKINDDDDEKIDNKASIDRDRDRDKINSSGNRNSSKDDNRQSTASQSFYWVKVWQYWHVLLD